MVTPEISSIRYFIQICILNKKLRRLRLKPTMGKNTGTILREDECQVPDLFEYGAECECCDRLFCLLCSLNFLSVVLARRSTYAIDGVNRLSTWETIAARRTLPFRQRIQVHGFTWYAAMVQIGPMHSVWKKLIRVPCRGHIPSTCS